MTQVRASAYIAVTLDGYIAGPGGDISWLDSYQGGEEDYGFFAFMDSVDCLVMGRNTYEQVLAFGQWPYGDKPMIVLSRSLTQLTPIAGACLSLFKEDLPALMTHCQQLGYQHLYVDGGKTIQSFLQQGLLNELIITRVPLLLGEGIALFDHIPRVPVQHVQTQAYASGLVQSHYRIGN